MKSLCHLARSAPPSQIMIDMVPSLWGKGRIMSTMQTTQPLPQLRSLLTRVVEQSENPIQCDFQFASQDIFFMLLESLLECFRQVFKFNFACRQCSCEHSKYDYTMTTTDFYPFRRAWPMCTIGPSGPTARPPPTERTSSSRT